MRRPWISWGSRVGTILHEAVAGEERDILLMKVTDHEWPIVCMARRVGYVAAIQLGEHYQETYEWLRWDIPRFRIGLRPAI